MNKKPNAPKGHINFCDGCGDAVGDQDVVFDRLNVPYCQDCVIDKNIKHS